MNLSLNERLEFLKHKQPPSAGTDDIYRTVSFTGYRPGKLPFGDDYECEMARKLQLFLNRRRHGQRSAGRRRNLGDA